MVVPGLICAGRRRLSPRPFSDGRHRKSRTTALLTTKLMVGVTAPIQSASGHEERFRAARPNGRCRIRKRSVAIDDWRRRLLSQALNKRTLAISEGAGGS